MRICPPGSRIAATESLRTPYRGWRMGEASSPNLVPLSGAVHVEEGSGGSEATAWVQSGVIKGKSAADGKELGTGDDLCQDGIFGTDRPPSLLHTRRLNSLASLIVLVMAPAPRNYAPGKPAHRYLFPTPNDWRTVTAHAPDSWRATAPDRTFRLPSTGRRAFRNPQDAGQVRVGRRLCKRQCKRSGLFLRITCVYWTCAGLYSVS